MAVQRLITIVIFLASWMFSEGQIRENTGKQVPDAFCISTMEYKLYSMINAYRQRYDLPPIPLSKSLCFVASTHVKDLFFHHPDKGTCNAHSWSDQGSWKPLCYPRDENKHGSAWDKPKELTPYPGKGFEIVYWENDAAVIDSVIALWKSMDYFNSFLMNTGKWQGKKWNAIGIGIHENYACAWFGESTDPEGEPAICGLENREVSKPAKVSPPLLIKNENNQQDPVNHNLPPVKPKAVPSQTSPQKNVKESYYLIVKGVAPEKDLQRCLKELLAKGYTTSKLVEKEGKQRVSIMEFQNKMKADSALRQVKKTWQDAWILEK